MAPSLHLVHLGSSVETRHGAPRQSPHCTQTNPALRPNHRQATLPRPPHKQVHTITSFSFTNSVKECSIIQIGKLRPGRSRNLLKRSPSSKYWNQNMQPCLSDCRAFLPGSWSVHRRFLAIWWSESGSFLVLLPVTACLHTHRSAPCTTEETRHVCYWPSTHFPFPSLTSRLERSIPVRSSIVSILSGSEPLVSGVGGAVVLCCRHPLPPLHHEQEGRDYPFKSYWWSAYKTQKQGERSWIEDVMFKGEVKWQLCYRFQEESSWSGYLTYVLASYRGPSWGMAAKECVPLCDYVSDTRG